MKRYIRLQLAGAKVWRTVPVRLSQYLLLCAGGRPGWQQCSLGTDVSSEMRDGTQWDCNTITKRKGNPFCIISFHELNKALGAKIDRTATNLLWALLASGVLEWRDCSAVQAICLRYNYKTFPQSDLCGCNKHKIRENLVCVINDPPRHTKEKTVIYRPMMGSECRLLKCDNVFFSIVASSDKL